MTRLSDCRAALAAARETIAERDSTVALLTKQLADCRAATAKPIPKGISVGGPFTYDWTPAQQQTDLDILKAAGCQWIRIDLAVGNTGPGRDLARRARQQGLKVLGCLVWGRGTTINAFQAAAAAQAEAPLLDALEVGNECNLIGQWPSTPEAYAAVYNAAKAGAAKVSQIPVISTGLSPGPNVTGDLDPRVFLDRALAAGMQPTAIGWHPYCAPNYPSEDATWSTFTKMRDHWTFRKWPVWITEYGESTYVDGVTAGHQAIAIADIFRLWKEFGFTTPIFIYQGRDGGTDPYNDQHHYGIIGKPALEVYRNI